MPEEKSYTNIKTASQAKNGEKTDWKNIAEVRMVMYVVPVALAITVLVLLIGNH